jgi:hypothetical protein
LDSYSKINSNAKVIDIDVLDVDKEIIDKLHSE